MILSVIDFLNLFKVVCTATQDISNDVAVLVTDYGERIFVDYKLDCSSLVNLANMYTKHLTLRDLNFYMFELFEISKVPFDLNSKRLKKEIADMAFDILKTNNKCFKIEKYFTVGDLLFYKNILRQTVKNKNYRKIQLCLCLRRLIF